MEDMICDLVLTKIRKNKFNPDCNVMKDKNFMQTVNYIKDNYNYDCIQKIEYALIKDKILLN